MPYRVGFGFDVHPIKEGRPFILGGLLIEHPSGPAGHSDADVLIHALCDALLGAASLGDIGAHFPDTGEKWKDADSKILLKNVIGLIHEKGYKPVNADLTICLEAPRIAPYIAEMRNILSGIMGVDFDAVSIKATTSEKMGYIGRGEGLAAYAVCLLEKAS